MDKPARPGSPVVLLDRCRVAIAAQESGTVGIVAERNHSAYNDLRIPQGTTTPEFASRTSRSARGSGVVMTGIPNAPYSTTLVGRLQRKLGRLPRRQRPASAPLMLASACWLGRNPRQVRFPLVRPAVAPRPISAPAHPR